MLTRKDAEALAREVHAVPYGAGSWHSGPGIEANTEEKTITIIL